LADTEYAFIAAYLNGQEAKTVNPDYIERMSNISSFSDILTAISETDIGNYLQGIPIKTFDEVDECLWKYLGDCIARIEGFRFLPDDVRKILQVYIVKYDVANVKAAILGILTQRKAGLIPLGRIHDRGLLDALSQAETVNDVADILVNCELEAFAAIIKEHGIEVGLKSRLTAEAQIDSEYYRKLMDVTLQVEDGFVLAKAFGLIIDLLNLQIISRAIIQNVGVRAADFTITSGYILSTETVKELLSLRLPDLPGRLGANSPYRGIAEEIVSGIARNESITLVDEIIEKHKYNLVRGILSPKILSPLMIVWYMIVKENELRNVRLLIKAAFDELPLTDIKQCLTVKV
jgi:vacuolar-type H+-ATPase subunit C/Vma6